MPFSLDIHPDIADDITEIAMYLNDRDPGLGDDFVIAVDDTLDQLESELNQNFVSGRKFDNVFAKSIQGAKTSPSYSNKFKKYCLWYEVDEVNERVYLCTVAFTGRMRDTIKRIIAGRRDL